MDFSKITVKEGDVLIFFFQRPWEAMITTKDVQWIRAFFAEKKVGVIFTNATQIASVSKEEDQQWWQEELRARTQEHRQELYEMLYTRFGCRIFKQ